MMQPRTRAAIAAGLFLFVAVIPAITATTPSPTDNLLTTGNVVQTSSATGAARWTSAIYDGSDTSSDRWYSAGVHTDTCGTNPAQWSEWRFKDDENNATARTVESVFVDARSAVDGSGFMACLSIYGLEDDLTTWTKLGDLGFSGSGKPRSNQTINLAEPTNFFGIRYSVSRISGTNEQIGVEIYETGVYGDQEAPPSAILDLEATNKTQSVALSWSSPIQGSAPISNYTIKRDGVTVATITNTTPTTYTYEASETPTADHVWTVTAANAFGSGPSATVTAHAADPPGAVGNFTVEGGPGPRLNYVNGLNWTEPTAERPISSYQIYKRDPLDSAYSQIGTTTDTEFTDYGPTTDHYLRCYVVTASSDGIEGTPSDPESYTRSDCPAF